MLRRLVIVSLLLGVLTGTSVAAQFGATSGPAGSGDITDVFGCATGDCSDFAAADGDQLDFCAVTPNTASEGICLPTAATCTGTPDGGTVCYGSTGDELCVYDGAAWDCVPLSAHTTDTGPGPDCIAGNFQDGTPSCVDVITEAELNSEAELEAQLVGVSDVFTDNDGALNDDDVTLSDVQAALSNDFHNAGGTDDDQPDSDAEVPDGITVDGIDAGAATTRTGEGKIRIASHDTDCTSLTDGLAREICYEEDGNTFYICEPTAGGCDTAGEWIGPFVTGAHTTDTTCSDAACAVGSDDTIDGNNALTRDDIDETLVSIQTHLTDCTALTCDATSNGELCFEADAQTLYVCDGPDTAWRLFDASAHTTEVNDLGAAVTWANVPDANVAGVDERDEVCGTTDLSSACEINASVVGRAEIDESLLSIQTHATDCTALTCDAGSDGELCFEQDADTFYVCDGSGTPAWKVFATGTHTTDTGPGPDCSAGSFQDGTPSCIDVITEAELASRADLNTQLGTSIADGAHTADQVSTTTAENLCHANTGGTVVECDLPPTNDGIAMGNTSTFAISVVPDCDGATDKLKYNVTGNAWGCVTDDDVPESGDFGAGDDLESTGALSANVVDYDNLRYDNTLAANPALLADECVPISTATGACILCEGSTADTNEQLYCFPDTNGADTTHNICIDDGSADGANCPADADTVFTPNADPSVDHSSYVAGHSDGGNCLAGEIPLGTDGSGVAQGCYEPTEADIADLAHTTDTSCTLGACTVGVDDTITQVDGVDAGAGATRANETKIKIASHDTDCTSLTDGVANELCYEEDSGHLYVCEPTAGGCDTAAEWIRANLRTVQEGGSTKSAVSHTDNYTAADFDVSCTAGVCTITAAATIMRTNTTVVTGQMPARLANDDAQKSFGNSDDVTIHYDSVDDRLEILGKDVLHSVVSGTAANLTTTGVVSVDTDATPLSVTMGDGTDAKPMRACWAERAGASHSADAVAVPGVADDVNTWAATTRTAIRASYAYDTVWFGWRCRTWQDLLNATETVVGAMVTAGSCSDGVDGAAKSCTWTSRLTCTIGVGTTATNEYDCAAATVYAMAAGTEWQYSWDITGSSAGGGFWQCEAMVCLDENW